MHEPCFYIPAALVINNGFPVISRSTACPAIVYYHQVSFGNLIALISDVTDSNTTSMNILTTSLMNLHMLSTDLKPHDFYKVPSLIVKIPGMLIGNSPFFAYKFFLK